jgi:hypothetical protein
MRSFGSSHAILNVFEELDLQGKIRVLAHAGFLHKSVRRALLRLADGLKDPLMPVRLPASLRRSNRAGA